MTVDRPRMGTIKTAIEYSGLSRSSLYSLAGTHPRLFKKFGRTVLVDLAVLDEILNALPNAQIKIYGVAAAASAPTEVA